jgi:hypothetical protein
MTPHASTHEHEPTKWAASLRFDILAGLLEPHKAQQDSAQMAVSSSGAVNEGLHHEWEHLPTRPPLGALRC